MCTCILYTKHRNVSSSANTCIVYTEYHIVSSSANTCILYTDHHFVSSWANTWIWNSCFVFEIALVQISYLITILITEIFVVPVNSFRKLTSKYLSLGTITFCTTFRISCRFWIKGWIISWLEREIRCRTLNVRLCTILSSACRDSSVSVQLTTGQMSRIRFSAWERFFPSSYRPDQLLRPPSLLSSGYMGIIFPRINLPITST
jgi:hypothetical protein